jgi:8-oxo-dGTP diphosphatase
VAIGKRIAAAGAVITREGNNGTEFLLIHRHLREDWTFPKGKVDPGENIVGAAVREVREETGFAIRLGLPLPTQHYTANGIPKDVNYWHATILNGDFTPNEEVDEIRWLSFDDARELLTYAHDADVLAAAATATPTSPLIVLRHTQAMKRAEWAATEIGSTSPDAARPLTAVGRMQANTLVSALAAFGVTQVNSSDSRRCRDTVGPYASARSISINFEPSVSEEQHLIDPDLARQRVRDIAVVDEPVLLCTHRPVLPSVMDVLSNIFAVQTDGTNAFNPALTPGSMVIYHRDAQNLSNILAVERHIH